MDHTTSTSLIIPITAAASLQPFRDRYLHRPGVTMPPHVTLLSPFLAPSAIDATARDILRATCAAFPAFAFHLVRLGRFATPGVLYLEPEPIGALLALRSAVAEMCAVMLTDEPVFHLTLAGWHPTELDTIAERFLQTYGDQLPLGAQATEVCLYVERGERWLLQECFSLLASARSGARRDVPVTPGQPSSPSSE